jgi:cell division septal protein FtsQ
VLDFRRRGTPPRRRRKNLLVKLLKPLVAAVALVATPAALVAWVLTAPLFRLGTVEVKTAKGPVRVSPDWVRGSLAPLRGKNLVQLSLADATARVQRNPWIASVEVTKELPDRLRVKIAERKPVALLLAGKDLAFADAEGRPIAPVATPAELEAARKAGLLVVSFTRESSGGIAPIAPALAAAAELGRVEPNWAGHLTQIEVLGEGEFRLRTEALPFPLLVNGGEIGPKVRRLVTLLPELTARYPRIQAVDLRFSRRIVVQPDISSPAAPAGGGAGA